MFPLLCILLNRDFFNLPPLLICYDVLCKKSYVNSAGEENQLTIALEQGW